jgi:hypothetical protein
MKHLILLIIAINLCLIACKHEPIIDEPIISEPIIVPCDSVFVMQKDTVKPSYFETDIPETPNGAIALTLSVGCCDTIYSNNTLDYAYQWAGPNGYTAATKDIANLKYGWYSITITCLNDTLIRWYWVARTKIGG